MRWYLEALRHYADFGGRARRTEYWVFTLVNSVILIPLEIIMRTAKDPDTVIPIAIFVIIFCLAIMIPSIAVAVRRLHDQDKSGAWYFVVFIPCLIGAIWSLVLMCTDGTRGPNQYGDDPRVERNPDPDEGRPTRERKPEILPLSVPGGPVQKKPAWSQGSDEAAKYVMSLTLSRQEAHVGDEVFAEIAYQNMGDESKDFLIVLKVNTFDQGSTQVSAPPGFRGSVTMPVPFSSPGRYYVMAGGLQRTLVVS